MADKPNDGSSTIKIHPLANLLPRMSKKEYGELTEDVKKTDCQRRCYSLRIRKP
jgi:hypothetical protein